MQFYVFSLLLPAVQDVLIAAVIIMAIVIINKFQLVAEITVAAISID